MQRCREVSSLIGSRPLPRRTFHPSHGQVCDLHARGHCAMHACALIAPAHPAGSRLPAPPPACPPSSICFFTQAPASGVCTGSVHERKHDMRTQRYLQQHGSHRQGGIELDWPHAGVEPIELADAQREPRNAGPPGRPVEPPPRVGWGPVSLDGQPGYGERLPDGTVQYWRPLPPRHAQSRT